MLTLHEKVELALIGVCAVIGALGWHEHSLKLEAVGAARVYQERADSLYIVAGEREGALDAISLSENALIDLRTAERDSATARADRAEAHRPAVIDRVVAAAGPDSAVVRGAVQEVADSIVVNEIVPLRAAKIASDSVAVSRLRQLDATLVANASLRAALEASRAEADTWQKAAQPKTLGFIHVGPLPAFVLGAVVGLAVALR